MKSKGAGGRRVGPRPCAEVQCAVHLGRTGSRPSTKSTSATSPKTPQPASSSACLSGPGPSTSRSIAWRSRKAGSWSQPRRVIAKVEWHPGELCPRVGFIVTNMSRPAENVVAFYNKCGTCEQWIKEGKGAIKWTRLSCRSFAANAVRLQLHRRSLYRQRNAFGCHASDRKLRETCVLMTEISASSACDREPARPEIRCKHASKAQACQNPDAVSE